MKKIILTLIFFSLLGIGIIISVLSTTGYETSKFNSLITNKIMDNNKNIKADIKKIKFKFDLSNISLFLETINPEVSYKNLEIPIKSIKVYLDFVSLIQSKIKISKMEISSNNLDITQLKKIIIKTKPTNLNSFILNKVNKGELTTNVQLFFDENLNVKNFIAKGSVNNFFAKIEENLKIKNSSFDFIADFSDVLVKNFKSELAGIVLKDGSLQINKREKDILLKSDFTTEVVADDENTKKYLELFKNISVKNFNADLKTVIKHSINLSFDKTFKINNYSFKGNGEIKELNIDLYNPIKNNFLTKEIDKIFLKSSNLDYSFSSNNKNFINLNGKYGFNKKEFLKYKLENNFFKKNLGIKADLEIAEKIDLSLINYVKNENEIAQIIFDITYKKNDIFFKKINYKQKKSLLEINDLNIKNNVLINLKNINVKTYNKEKNNNDFSINFDKGIKIKGNKYDATNLNKFLNQKSKNNILKNISKKIDIDFKNVATPLSKKLSNFKLIGQIYKGKFIKITSKGDFGNNKYLDISMKSDAKNSKKYLEIYSDLPQPLLTEYSFFKGLSGGTLMFSSIIESDSSSSKLVIEDFKVINAPGVVKLLSLADFGGLADLAEGEGLSFDKMEINILNNRGFLKIKELYAVGPSISVLMDGYKEKGGLVSLRGTLVPAKNLNKFLSKIPVIGKIIIPEEVGEGLFGVSFKMKGTKGKIKTSLNPIKTLTPRFITKALEKTSQSK